MWTSDSYKWYQIISTQNWVIIGYYIHRHNQWQKESPNQPHTFTLKWLLRADCIQSEQWTHSAGTYPLFLSPCTQVIELCSSWVLIAHSLAWVTSHSPASQACGHCRPFVQNPTDRFNTLKLILCKCLHWCKMSSFSFGMSRAFWWESLHIHSQYWLQIFAQIPVKVDGVKNGNADFAFSCKSSCIVFTTLPGWLVLDFLNMNVRYIK